MIAVRYDESAASAMGVTPAAYKLLAMGLAGAIAGLAGAFLVAVTGLITPGSFDLFRSFDITLFAIVGGVTSGFGGAFAAAFLTYLTEAIRPLTEYRLLIFGAVLILGIFFRAGVMDRHFRVVSETTRKTVAFLRRHH